MFRSLFSQTLLQLCHKSLTEVFRVQSFNPCFLRLSCNVVRKNNNRSNESFNPCFLRLFCNPQSSASASAPGPCFNPCFLRLFCNKPFLMWGSTPRPRKPCKGLKKSFTKRTLFCFAKSTSIFISGEGIGNPNLFFGSNLFLKGLMFQSLFSQTLLQPCGRRDIQSRTRGVSILVFVDSLATPSLSKEVASIVRFQSLFSQTLLQL